ncbi:biliverdin-producing heme oxygenase, partial [Mycobacterium tuberculosis]|nr:biliverdin-producing heme oxygenase [Mycobacterium tuberculosis]
ALEDRARMFADDPVFAPFHDPRLERHERIVSDLTALGSGDIAVTEAALDYASRLAAIETPEAMIAHHYTRYLGDLSGGQAIGTLMGRHYG